MKGKLNQGYFLNPGSGKLSARSAHSAQSAWAGIQYNQEQTQSDQIIILSNLI